MATHEYVHTLPIRYKYPELCAQKHPNHLGPGWASWHHCRSIDVDLRIQAAFLIQRSTFECHSNMCIEIAVITKGQLSGMNSNDLETKWPQRMNCDAKICLKSLKHDFACGFPQCNVDSSRMPAPMHIQRKSGGIDSWEKPIAQMVPRIPHWARADNINAFPALTGGHRIAYTWGNGDDVAGKIDSDAVEDMLTHLVSLPLDRSQCMVSLDGPFV